MWEKRCQISVEYVMIVGIAMLLLVPVIVLFNNEKQDMQDDFNMVQASNLLQRIVDNAEKVHFLGKPAKTTLTATLPPNVESMTIGEDGISMMLDIKGGSINISASSSISLQGNISSGPGMKRIVIQAEEDYVNVTSG